MNRNINGKKNMNQHISAKFFFFKVSNLPKKFGLTYSTMVNNTPSVASRDSFQFYQVSFWRKMFYFLKFVFLCFQNPNWVFWRIQYWLYGYRSIASHRGASDSVANSSALSDPVDSQNISCLGHCGRDIYPKTYA